MGFKNLREARSHLSLKDFRRLHAKAEKAVEDLQTSELSLIKTLQVIEDNKVHRWCGYNSLFEYGVQCLGLSRSQSYMYVSLSKATRKYKKLELALSAKKLTASKATRVLSVMTLDNQQDWITKAMTLPKSQLEKEVVRLNPKKARGERFEYLTSEVIEMKTPVSEGVYKMLIRAQDLLSESLGRSASMEEVFAHLVKEFLHKKDPVERANRQVEKKARMMRVKGKLQENLKELKNRDAGSNDLISNLKNFVVDLPKEAFEDFPAGVSVNLPDETFESFPSRNQWGQRLPIPRKVIHGVHLRDQKRCRHHYPSGERCKSTRWLHLHHKKPVSVGGEHSLENIVTLCPAHHDLAHLLK